MELVAKVMNPKHKMSKKDVIAAHNEPVILSLHCEAEQCPKPLFFGSSFVVPFTSHINRKKHVYEHAEHPTQDTGGANVFRSFYFKLYPPRVPRVGWDSLEDPQGAGGTNGHTSGHSVNM
ncbi:Hypothetical predicted protein [Lynx pardinus]|uniref:Uncharacterized protein n=1 Tax=Lynx pardinus TaxID=191816 RepID=A0A485PG15_LYNPA|nr:Hypothetical predicted protein [Lynx pardinus]